MLKKFLLDSNNVSKDSYLWNTIGSFFIAFESVIIMAFMTRAVGLEIAGIFNIAIADANLFLNIGKYGMRSFQASDVQNQFSFEEYQKSRWLTTTIMLVCSIAYVLYCSLMNNYSSEKTAIIIMTCIYKMPDSIEDIFYGEYQRRGRLDVSGKCLAIRSVSSTFVLAVTLIITKNILLSLVITTIYAFIILILLIKTTIVIGIKANVRPDFKQVELLLLHCLPIAAGFFLSYYIGNAPKYAIDACLTDEIQACYGFISMPIFVIGLMNGLIFNPAIYSMSKAWREGKTRKFLNRIIIQIIVIVGITCSSLIAAYLIGIPVLSALFGTDLSAYKLEFMALIIGGGFLAVTGLFTTVLTIVRKQGLLIVGYLLVAGIARLFTRSAVEARGIWGAVEMYDILMILLSMMFIIFLGVTIIKRNKQASELGT